MSKKTEIFKRIERNKVWQVVVFLLLEVVVLGIYFVGGKWAKEEGRKDTISDMHAVVDYSILTQIEEVSIQEREIVLSGWALRLNSKKTNLDIVLKDVNGADAFVYETEGVPRKDVEVEFDSAWDYGESGFEVKIPTKKLDNDTCYEIQLGISYIAGGEDEKLTKISTNRYLYKGEMFSYNPLTFEEPKLNAEEIMDVVNRGNLCAYSSEKNIWVYKNAERMYWILDERYVPNLEEAPGIPWTLYTYRGDWVSNSEVIDNGETIYVHYGIDLQESDLIEGEDAKYYVVSMEIPKGYPITYIRTGNWTRADLWIYRTEFQFYEYDRK